MDQILLKIYNNISDSTEVEKILFRLEEVDFYFKNSTGNATMIQIADKLDIEYESSDRILTLKRASRSKNIAIYESYESLFDSIYRNLSLSSSTSLIVLDKTKADYYIYDLITRKEHLIVAGQLDETFYLTNYSTYLPLLKLFRADRHISEFDDVAKNKLLIIDNNKERNLVNIKYAVYDPRIFTKKVEFDYNSFENRITQLNISNNQEWVSCLKHNIVSVMSAQQEENKTFAELFLNIQFIISNTERDYEIYISGFSFEKVSKALKEDKQKYFQTLNQAQDRIKSQVIAVPLSIGTSIYAFFQLETNIRNYYFILVMIAVYILFICWYLWLYEQDLRKLKKDVKEDRENFTKLYPKVFEIFKADFDYIKNKITSVILLSWVIKSTIIADWIILLLYVICIRTNPEQMDPFRNIFHLI